SPQERAQRRAAELQAAGGRRTAEEILKEILARDALDSGRAASPLSVAADAVVVDSTGRSIDEVVSCILEMVQRGKRREGSV
ncbi:MAG TPA: (d)CMP kinase, partial [Actinomycetota bacterium]